IDSLFDEFAGELTLLKSIPPRIDETVCHPEKETRFSKRLLYDNSSPRPPEEIVFDNSNVDIESFSPSPIPVEDSDSHMEEINLPFTPDDPMSPVIKEEDYDSGRDIPILEELLDNYSLSLLDNESYHFDIPSPYRPPAKPPDGKTGTLNIKMMGDVSDQKVPIPGLTITLSPTNRSDFTYEEFGDEPAHIISPPEYECFYFGNFPDPGELISSLNFRIRENLSSTTCGNLPVEDDYSPLLAYVVWIFIAHLMYPVIPPHLHSFRNEDTIFDPGITINCFYSFKPGLSHRCGTFKKFNTHHSHLNKSPMNSRS
nr:hypothetical protein [Tanacetum cinerariifolium]